MAIGGKCSRNKKWFLIRPIYVLHKAAAKDGIQVRPIIEFLGPPGEIKIIFRPKLNFGESNKCSFCWKLASPTSSCKSYFVFL